MRQTKISASFGPLFLSVLLVATTQTPSAHAQSPSAEALTSGTQETLLGPSKQAAMFVVSSDGGHYAYLAYSAQAGPRMVVDGKASERFTELVVNSMRFSEDGGHYVYAIRMDSSRFQLIRDGVATSVETLGAFTTVSGPPRIDFPPLIFSNDGTRLAWTWVKSDGISGNTISIDGQEILHSHGIYKFPEFSPDSKHFATMVGAGNKVALAVDGNTGPGYDSFLATNPNAARFLDSHTFRFLGVKNGAVYRVTVNLGG